jgi:hypothetical protein
LIAVVLSSDPEAKGISGSLSNGQSDPKPQTRSNQQFYCQMQMIIYIIAKDADFFAFSADREALSVPF